MIKRIIATFLAVLTIFGAFTVVASAEETSSDEFVPEFNTGSNKPALDNYLTSEYTRKDEKGASVKDVVDTKEEKLELMDLRVQSGDYRLYVDAYSGEVAVEKISTGEVMFTNPYNVTGLSDSEKEQVLSQLKISYKDTTQSDALVPYQSFTQAVMGGDLNATTLPPSQINVRFIQNGLRVEYALGRADSRYLVPEVMDVEAFETQIKAVAVANGCSEFQLMLLDSLYTKIDITDKKYENSPTVVEAFLKKYPMLQKKVDGELVNRPIFVLSDDAKANVQKKNAIERIIKRYCPEFTYEILENYYSEIDYTSDTPQSAYFKIALEYTLTDNGVSVRLPANGIRFDESLFRLEEIEILPYMGAGLSVNEGYTFFPDGSGALFPFNKSGSFKGRVYGEDFGYYNIANSSPHNEVVRYPVFGLSETVVDSATGKAHRRGFLGIIEEGEAMMDIVVNHTGKYNSIILRTNPRPYDTILPSGATQAWYVVSERKYVDDYKIRYIMLSDNEGCSADYVGMAKEYRDYLVGNGTLTKLTNEDVEDTVPLYIETFGAIETTKKFLSIPYKTNVALTSFKDISTMYDELSQKGVDNINFILTGYGKGGLTKDTVPYKLKWDGAVKKDMSFEELLKDANDKSYGVYPDFDFAFAGENTLTDGLTLDDHVIKSIDGRYTSKRVYSATRQNFVSYFELAISPAYFSRFYEKLTEQYIKTNPQGISVSTLGEYVSSDFDEDEPYNREDNKQFTIDAFKYFSEKYSKVITSGGNSYSWKYVDAITDIATDSSRHSMSTATVPFLGIVLHGYVETASTPINMEGNIDYAMLRAIENGTAFKFMLSYDNTEVLKEYEDTSDYYSIRYDIWLADLAARYDEINRLLQDVQTSTIEEHKFISAVRIPESNEIKSDADDALAAAIAKEKADAAAKREDLRVQIQMVRADILKYNELVKGEDYGYGEAKTVFDNAKAEYDTAKAAAAAEGATDEQKAASTAAAEKAKAAYADLLAASEKYIEVLNGANVRVASLATEFALLGENNAYTPEIIADLKVMLVELLANTMTIKNRADQCSAAMAGYNTDLTANAPELLPAADADNDEIKDDTATNGTASAYDKYAVVDATVVYEKYSNGKTFILNFNNYAIKVTIDGVSYTVSAYGYAVIR